MKSMDEVLENRFKDYSYIDLIINRDSLIEAVKRENKELGYMKALTASKLNNIKLELLRRNNLTIKIK